MKKNRKPEMQTQERRIQEIRVQETQKLETQRPETQVQQTQDNETWKEWKNSAYTLLKRWCDALLAHQIKEMPQKALYGGILCPACGRIHGRCADAIVPMLYMANKTGEVKYRESAERLFDWSEIMVQSDGRYWNDFDSDWAGITVFAGIGLAEVLLEFSSLLEESTIVRWKERLRRAVEFSFEHIMEFSGNINYPVTASYLFALAGQVFEEERFHKKARELAHWSLDYITLDGLFYGEGLSRCRLTEKGCRPVDLGYNVEESLPALLHYAILEKDEEVFKQVTASMKAHAFFMLPDGAWNNSWGTRNNKWAYWGSRTSDGCASGWDLAGEEEPLFLEVVRRNVNLLERCTGADGLLFGGPMYQDAGVAPCIHHTFCHAKALAECLHRMDKSTQVYSENSLIKKTQASMLPIETFEGVQFSPSIRVWTVKKHGFFGTISDYDMIYSKEGHAHGGALTLLWAEGVGVVFVGTMTQYEILEHGNMQLPPELGEIALTPRLQYQEEGRWYRSCNDTKALVNVKEEKKEDKEIVIEAQGRLRDREQRGNASYLISYHWDEEKFWMEAECKERDVEWYVPIVASSKDVFYQKSEREWELRKENGKTLVFQSNLMFEVPEKRTFHPVGGFQAGIVILSLKAKQKGKFSCSIIR